MTIPHWLEPWLNGGLIGLIAALALAAFLIAWSFRKLREQCEPEQEPEDKEARSKYEQAATEFEIHSVINTVDHAD